MSTDTLRTQTERKGGDGRSWFLRGMKDGVPISMGYFAVSFTLGITVRKAGMSAVQAGVMSALMLASAGQFAGLNSIITGAGCLEIAAAQIIVNLRYLLMSGALSQKVRRDVPFYHRFLMAYGVTDEIFGISMAVEGKLYPAYQYGAVAVAAPGWVAGTVLGVLLGMILPPRVMSAMNVALYGMFLAVVIPPTRKNKILAGLVPISMAASLLFTLLPGLRGLSGGTQMILLTILLAGGAAYLFPVEEKEENDEA